MTSRERAQAAMLGRRPDRVPVVPLIDTSYAAACLGVPVSECFLNPAVHAQALAAALERHPGIDGLSVNIGLTDAVIADQRQTPDGYLIETLDGCLWNVPWNDVGTPVTRSVTSFQDERLRTHNVLQPHILETVRRLPPALLRTYDISVGLTGPFSQVLFTMGLDRVLPAMIEEAAELKAAVAARIPFALRWAEEAATLGAPSVWIGEGFSSASLISPAQYSEFVLPAEQCVTRRLRELGIPSVLHICGKATRTLDHIARSGADCFEADWQVDLTDARSRFAGRVSLKGNLHTTLLLQADPEAICQAATAALLQAGASDGGFLLSSGCALGRDTPLENVDAMVRAVDRIG